MKRFLCLLLIFAVLFSLSACGSEYPPVKSTAEESKTVITLSYGGRNYKVKYELYRAFFLNYHTEVDGGDLTVYQGADGANYRAEINRLILEKAAEIYAVEALCREIDYDIYSKDADKQVKEYIKISIEGGTVDGVELEGVGSYDNYLQSLKEQYVNYSVQDLIYRYFIGDAYLEEYYCGTDSGFTSEFSFGETKYSETDLRTFYDGESCVRVLWCYLPANVYTAEKLSSTRDKIVTASGKGTTQDQHEYNVGVAMINVSTGAAEDILGGQLITENSLDETYYGEIADAAFALEVGEVSQPIAVESDLYQGYFIVYRTVKTDAYFESHKDDVKNTFLFDALGKKIQNVKDAMIGSAEFTKEILSLDFTGVTMN